MSSTMLRPEKPGITGLIFLVSKSPFDILGQKETIENNLKAIALGVGFVQPNIILFADVHIFQSISKRANNVSSVSAQWHCADLTDAL